MLPSEIETALGKYVDAVEADMKSLDTKRDHLDRAITDNYHALGTAILKYGDQRYEEGIEAGRELEQTKMSGN